MRAIEGHRVEFGELAGPLIRGSTLFDWQLIATQRLGLAVDYPFAEIVADDGVPYAPVVAATSVHRYPGLGESVDVDVVPINVGDSSTELVYDVTDDGGDPVATARITHVTVGPDGTARPLPGATRPALEALAVDRDPTVGPALEPGDALEGVTFSRRFPVRSPHVEGVEWGYFEEYPRFAMIAAEAHLEGRGGSLGTLTDGQGWFRPTAWRWEFGGPVPYESTLEVAWDVRAADTDGLLVEHTFEADGREAITGTSVYRCVDEAGEVCPLPEALIAAFKPT